MAMWSSDIVFCFVFGSWSWFKVNACSVDSHRGGRLIRNAYNLFTVLYHDRSAVYHVRPLPVRKGWARERSCMEHGAWSISISISIKYRQRQSIYGHSSSTQLPVHPSENAAIKKKGWGQAQWQGFRGMRRIRGPGQYGSGREWETARAPPSHPAPQIYGAMAVSIRSRVNVGLWNVVGYHLRNRQ